jgi:peptidoglycan/LPS O-acetylase OafA/YrhL
MALPSVTSGRAIGDAAVTSAVRSPSTRKFADPASAAPSRLLSIQALRGIAALLVVFNHAWDQLPWFKARFPLPIGHSGVDLFFVISGFVMVFITTEREHSPGSFAAARIIRIVPLYWFYTFAAAILLLTAPQLFGRNEFTLAHLIQSLAFVPHWAPADPHSISPMVKLGWTLNYEMFFYAVFTIAMVISTKARVWISLAVLIALAGLGTFIHNGGVATIQVYTDNIVLEFAFGMMLAKLFGVMKPFKGDFAVACALILVGAVGIVVDAQWFEIYPRCLVYGLPAAAAVLGCLILEAGHYGKFNRLLLLTGDASYSIYLAHLFPLAILRFAWNRLDLPTVGWGATTIFVMLCWCLGVCAGIVSYLAIERPLSRVARRAAKHLMGTPAGG